MCILRQRDVSSDDLAFLTASRFVNCEPDEDAIQRALSIHEPSGVDFSPVCLSQITKFHPYRSTRHFRRE